MMRTAWMGWGITWMIVAWMALGVWATPILPRFTALHPEVQTLAKMRRVVLAIEPFHPLARETGLSEAEVQAKWAQSLTEGGFEIVDEDGQTPEIHVYIFAVEDRSVRNAFGYFITLTVVQDVQVSRLDKNVRIPSWTTFRWGLVAKGGFRNRLEDELAALKDMFLKRQKEATDAG